MLSRAGLAGYEPQSAIATIGADPAWSTAVIHAKRIGAAALVGLLGSGPAAGQTTADQPQGRYLLGSSLSVTPAVVLVVGRDSNAIRTDTGVPAGEYYVVPQIEGWLGRGRVRLNFANAVEVSSQKTATDVKVSTLNQYHTGRLDVGGPRVSFQAVAGHRDHYAPPTDFVGFELGLKSRRIEREFGVSMNARPGGRLLFGANASRSQLRYDADQRFQGASLEQNLNRNITAFGGEARLLVSPLTSFGVSLSGYRDRFLFAPERDGNGTRVLVGAAFSPRALLSGRAEAGYLRYNVVQSGARYGGPAYNLGLAYSRPPTIIDLSGRRTIEYSFDPGRGFYVSNGLELYATTGLGRVWELFGHGSVRGMQPRGLLAANEPFRGIEEYKGGLIRKFGSSTRLGIDAERYVTGGPGGFSGVRMTVFMIYGTTRLLRLDRPLPGGR